jgi:hypothetical protein
VSVDRPQRLVWSTDRTRLFNAVRWSGIVSAMQLFDPQHTDQLASRLADHADQLRHFRARLVAEMAAMHWSSPAAVAFHQAFELLLRELTSCSARSEQSATQLREHGRRAAHRAHEVAAAAAGVGTVAGAAASAVTHPGRLARGLFTAL